MKKRSAVGVIAVVALTMSAEAGAKEERDAKSSDLAAPVNETLLEELRASPHTLLFEHYERESREVFLTKADLSCAGHPTPSPAIDESCPQSSPEPKSVAPRTARRSASSFPPPPPPPPWTGTR